MPENTPKKDEVTGTLDKILEEISSLKQLKQDVLDLKDKSNQSFKRFRPTMGKVQMFGDSFFKYVQGSRAFGRNTKVVMNKCFTLDEVIRKLMEMDKDDEVSKVVLQCGFNDIVRERKKANFVFETLQQCMQLFKELFPNAVILIGEILPHPNDIQSNGRISTANYLIEEAFSSLKGDIRYVEHPICRSDNELYDNDGIHLNRTLGIPQILKDFCRVKQGTEPFLSRKNSNNLESQ